MKCTYFGLLGMVLITPFMNLDTSLQSLHQLLPKNGRPGLQQDRLMTIYSTVRLTCLHQVRQEIKDHTFKRLKSISTPEVVMLLLP